MRNAFYLVVICLLAHKAQSIIPQNQYILSQQDISTNNEYATQNQIKYIDDYTILKTIPRKGGPFFVEGLSFKDANTLVESVGGYGDSSIHYLDANDMTVLKNTDLDSKFFGEGCEIIDNKDGTQTVFQLTYNEKKVFAWDGETLELKEMLEQPREMREGWGMTKRVENGEVRLYASDGSHKIFVIDPEGFKIVKTLEVFDNEGEVQGLNELEFVKGKLWANIFASTDVVVINPDTGLVEAVIDFSGLKNQARQEMQRLGQKFTFNSVLNGIAYHSETDRLLLTGKEWPFMFEIGTPDI